MPNRRCFRDYETAGKGKRMVKKASLGVATNKGCGALRLMVRCHLILLYKIKHFLEYESLLLTIKLFYLFSWFTSSLLLLVSFFRYRSLAFCSSIL
jgi:hypothetical protein